MNILDCTLRDGGYVNNWEFDTETAIAVCEGLYAAGIRWIEIGILGKNATPGRQTKFADFNEMKVLLQNRKEDCHYAIMVTANMIDEFTFPVCSIDTPDLIRIAFFKPEFEKALDAADLLKQKGYRVFLQAMATFMYSDDELADMIQQINVVSPDGFYIVDSFSTMYPEEVVKMRDDIILKLKEDIMLGFHAHNNIQLGYANARQFMTNTRKRNLIVDGSIFGMGRGAGNVPTELLMHCLNRLEGKYYDSSIIMVLYQKYLDGFFKEYGWGYAFPYYLTAINHLNSVWGWYFMGKGIDDLKNLEDALKMIPGEWKYTLNQEVGEKILKVIKDREDG